MKAIQEFYKFTSIVRLSYPHVIWIWCGYGLFSAVVPFVSLYYSAVILNQLLSSAYDMAMTSVLIMSGMVMVFSLLSKAFYHRIQVMEFSAGTQMNQKLLKKTMVMEYEYLEKQETLDTLRRTRNSCNGSGDIGNVIALVGKCAISLFQITFSLVAFMILFIQMQTWDVYLLLLIIILIIFLSIRNKIAQKQGQLNVQLCADNDRTNAKNAYLRQLFYNMKMAKEIRIYQMVPLLHEKMHEFLQETTYRAYAKKEGKLMFLSDLITQVLTLFAYLYVASLALRSIISIGQVLYISGIIMNAVNAISQFQSDFTHVLYQLSYINSFYDFMNMSNMHYEGTLPIEKRNDGEYLFEFHNVSFHYPGTQDYVLKNINLTFDLHQKLAIVGSNGAGKTTIVKLLCRLYEPCEGEILLNGINIEKYDYKEYTSIFSVVFQDFKLFSYPLDENIAGSDTICKTKVNAVLTKLNIKEYIDTFTNKQHTLLFKENGDGVNVSGGEAQKLAIARALYKDAPFIILDEPTAALDPIAEAEIYENFDLLVEDKTTLYISHRMSSCKFCDRIIVLDNGIISEQGTHNELLLQNGLYKKLWNAQAKYYV